MRLIIASCLLFALSTAQTDPDPCACKPVSDSIENANELTTQAQVYYNNNYGGYCNEWEQEPWSPYSECHDQNQDFCGDLNYCTLKWCYVDGDCSYATASSFYDEDTFVSGQVDTQIFYSYEVCGTPNCFLDPKPVGCPFDPEGTYGCPATITSNVATHPIETGCPSGSGNSDIQMDFSTAKVIHRNLNGRWCEPGRWNSNGSSKDGSVSAADNSGHVNGIPADCFMEGGSAVPEEILYCDVGTDREGNELCIQVVDTSEHYYCETTLKCGNVLPDNAILGQIQIDQRYPDFQAASDERQVSLDFTVMKCDNVDTSSFDSGRDCTPQNWDNMFMTFLDLDGTEARMEEVTMHGIWDYSLAPNSGIQSGSIPVYENGVGLNYWTFGATSGGAAGPDGQVKTLADQWTNVGPFHAIYNGDTIVDNTKFLTQSGVMFPNMNIEISDPDHVYRWTNTEGNLVDNRLVGDVTVRNIPTPQNGNILNPTRLDSLSWDQASRAITANWVSEKWLNQQYNNIAAGEQRSSFQITMGTGKRTILFAGQAEAIISLCDTCATRGVVCPNNQALKVRRICEITGHSSIQDLADECNTSTCCEPVPTTHGDPIVWTFNQECYDLNKDGLYSATKHPHFDHEVKIAVYNNFMREVQVVNTKTGEILLSIDTTGTSMNNGFQYHFEEEMNQCPKDMKQSECDGSYMFWEFDAQNFRYSVHLLRHNYQDDGLLEGELGYHLDIYPRPYKSFESHKDEYTGLYFENPLPEELEYCPGGSQARREAPPMPGRAKVW